MGKHQPALLGGLFIGVLSSLPVVNLANCCCLWVLAGGALVVYLQQQQTPLPVETGNAAIGGLIAGAVGGVLVCAVQLVWMQFAGPAMFESMRSEMASNPQMPPQAIQMMEKFMQGGGLSILMFAMIVPLFAVFAMLGSLLGLLFFRKKQPPMAPPQQQPFGG